MKKSFLVLVILISSFLLISCRRGMVKVTFKFNNGLKDQVEYYKVNSKVTKPVDIPEKENTEFDSWYLSEEPFEFEKETVKTDITLDAKFLMTKDDMTILNNAIKNHEDSNNFEVNGSGSINASIITQSLNYKKSRNNDEIYLFNGSYGSALFGSIKVQPYIEVKGNVNDVTLEKGDINEDMSKNKVKSKESITYDKYKELYGVGLNNLNYIINEETFIRGVKISNNIYRINLHLDKSVVNYRTNITEMNPEESIKDSIKFTKIDLIISINENGQFNKISYIEEYSIRVKAPVIGWGNQDLSSTIIEKYKYN